MIMTTAIVSLYMVMVYVVGGEDGGTVWKVVLMGISLIGIIMQVARGRSKGKNFADSLVDNDAEQLKEAVENIVDIVVKKVPSFSESEE